MSEAVTLATIWQITRQDGTVFTFTDHDVDLDFSAAGILFGDPPISSYFSAALGYTRSAMKQSLNLETDVLEIMGAIDASGFTREDILSGKFDYALVEIGLVNPLNLNMGTIYLRRGYFGEVTVQDYNYIVSIKGLAEVLQRGIVKTYQPICQVDLGSSECTIDIDADSTQDGYLIRQQGTVITGTGLSSNERSQFCVSISTSPTAPTGYLNEGLLRWTSGSLASKSFEIDYYTTVGTPKITLLYPTPLPIQVGDTFNAYIGCNHQTIHCSTRFGTNDGRGNIRNYRGFPDIQPGYTPFIDRLLGFTWRT
jgi:uncharacterized phage protein (TIGR02218 family)